MSNEKQSMLLGMSFGKANQRLRKMIIFHLVKKLNLDICFRCQKKIEKIEELSIEHKTPWLNSDNPKFNFFDLNNISFSHCKCNYSDKTGYTEISRQSQSKANSGNNNGMAKLSNDQIIEIRKQLECNVPQDIIAKNYNISQPQISRIKNLKRWKS